MSKLVIGHQPLNRLLVGIQSELGAIKIGSEMYDAHIITKHSPSYEE
jgi:hypothetical protein